MTLRSTKTMWVLAMAAAAVVVLAACEPGDPGRSTGSYPIDIFQEMHYNQSYKAQEPPRFLPPRGSFPVSGGFLPAPSKSEAAGLTSPFDVNADTLARGALLYKQNCSVCHGLVGEGDGFVGIKFEENGAPPPPLFNSDRLQALAPGEAFVSVANGFGFMPAFQSLLTEEDRWALVTIIEASTEERRAALGAINDLSETERTNRLLELKGIVGP